MKTAVCAIVGFLLQLSVGFAQTPPNQPGNSEKIAALQSQIDKASTSANELAKKLRSAASDKSSVQEVPAWTTQLTQALNDAFAAQLELQLAQLADAEAKIDASRQHIAKRQEHKDRIVGRRIQELLNVPAHAASPQAVLDAMEQFTLAKDYAGLLSLMTDDEAARMAGMLLQSMSMMNAMLALLEASPDTINDSAEIRSVLAHADRFMRPTPSSEATAALQQVVGILPAAFYEIGATSNGALLERPNLTALEYGLLLRQASGVLTDTRAFSAAMMAAGSAMETDTDEAAIPSEWKIELDGVRATATQDARPITRTTNQLAKVELEVEGGLWKISKLGSDDEMMQALAGPSVQAEIPAAPSPPLMRSPYSSGDLPAAIIKEQIQGRWIVESMTEQMDDGLVNLAGPLHVSIDGNIMRHMIGTEELTGPILMVDSKNGSSLRASSQGAVPIDFVHDPNGEAETYLGIIACDGETLSICMSTEFSKTESDFRPQLFVPGSKVSLWKCRRAEE